MRIFENSQLLDVDVLVEDGDETVFRHEAIKAARAVLIQRYPDYVVHETSDPVEHISIISARSSPESGGWIVRAHVIKTIDDDIGTYVTLPRRT